MIDYDAYYRDINTIVSHYGGFSRKILLVEEVGELLSALARLSRGRASRKDIIEEIADVRVVLDQLVFYYRAGDEVDEIRAGKVRRQMARMRSEEMDSENEDG